VLMNPAQKGKGIIAGGAVRVITEMAGLRDIVCKVHGTKNPGSVVRATINGLQQLKTIDLYAADRGADPASAQQSREAAKKEAKAAKKANRKARLATKK